MKKEHSCAIGATDRHQQAEKIAIACRLLAFLGLAREKTGHVSARFSELAMLLRCRGTQEAGLAFTTPDVVRAMTLEGGFSDGSDQYVPPNEWPIHAAIYAARPDVGAVVHAHPYASTVVSLCNATLKPIIGAYDSSAMQLAIDGVPVYPRSILIRDARSAAELVQSIGTHDVCILRGHGIVAVGRTIEQATLRAIRLETLASLHLDVMKAGAVPQSIDAEDLAFWKTVKSLALGKDAQHRENVDQWTWRHYERLLAEHEKKHHDGQ
jgi:ribulose-5-phosphate 4-epimerase/fuculose-1-phosphate aldolase